MPARKTTYYCKDEKRKIKDYQVFERRPKRAHSFLGAHVRDICLSSSVPAIRIFSTRKLDARGRLRNVAWNSVSDVRLAHAKYYLSRRVCALKVKRRQCNNVYYELGAYGCVIRESPLCRRRRPQKGAPSAVPQILAQTFLQIDFTRPSDLVIIIFDRLTRQTRINSCRG